MGQRIILLGLVLVVLVLLGPSASAHVTHETDNGAYFITIGQQGEPVYTFQRTNLDLIIRENVDGERGDEVDGVHETLTAVLIGPGGQELPGTLTKQRETEGRYQFDGGYTLTQPGVYTLRLAGMIGDTVVDGVYDMPHTILSQGDVMFPDQGLADLRELNARVASLEAELETLKTQGVEGRGDENEAAAPGVLLLVGLAAGLGLFIRRRAGE